MLEWKELRLLEWREFRVKCSVRKELTLFEWKELRLRESAFVLFAKRVFASVKRHFVPREGA